MRDDDLRDAFRSLADGAGGECSAADVERVWLAVSGKLDAPERRALVERTTTEPALAEAWRVAQELWRVSQDGAATEAPLWQERWWSVRGLAAAAALVLVVTAAWLYLPGRAGDEVRQQRGNTIEALVPSGSALPRADFRLRWTPFAPGARYDVRVTTGDLRVITTAAGLDTPELVLTPGQLADVAPGDRILWQVDAVLQDGARVSSPTFAVAVR